MNALTIVNCTLPLASATSRSGSGNAAPQPATRYAVRIEGQRIAWVKPMTELSSPANTTHGSATLLGEPRGEALDARGCSVLPGFTDAHVHLVESGIELARCDLSAATSAAHTVRLIAHYCREHPNESWVIGRGWTLDHFADRSAMLAELDRLTGDRPAYLSNRDGHSAWVNSAALRQATIDRHRADPAGGVIERTADGTPNGLLHESAMLLVAELMPPLTDDIRLAGLLAGQRHFFSLGITGWQEAIVGEFVPTTDVARCYRRAIDHGALIGQVTGNLWLPREQPAAALDLLIEQRAAFAHQELLRMSGVKVMYDGVCETLTAAVSVPYLDGAAEPNRGITFFEPQQLAPVIAAVHQAGFDIHAHTIGDRASDEMLTMLAAAQAASPRSDHRHQLAHLQLLNPRLIERIARLGVIANVQPYWAQGDQQVTEMTLPMLDVSLHTHHYAFASLERSGVPLAFGSDWPVTTPNPFDQVHVAVNRSYPGNEDAPLLPHEALSRSSALRAATFGSAYAARQERDRGRLAPGMLGDVVLLDSDLDEVRDAELCAVRVKATVARGRVVYER